MNGRRFEGETFEGLVRRDCVLEGCAFYDCVFLRCTLENVRLVGCTFSGCTFNGCRVSELQTLHSTVSLAVLENCALVGVDWSRLLPAGMFAEPIAAMRACRLKYNSFFKMAFRGFDFTGSDLIGCNLQHTGHHTGHQNRDHCGHTAHYQARHDPAHQKGLFILILRHSIAYLHRD